MAMAMALPLAMSHPSPPHFTSRLRPRRIAACVSTTPNYQHRLAGGKGAAWNDFADHISGEWDGYGAEFSASGVPCELPASVVPETFKEWDVQIYDWQTQCPTIADKSLCYKLIRLLPTVGCEADAATQYSVDERQAADTDSGVEFIAFHVSGSYVALWPGKRVLRENYGLGNPSKRFLHERNKHGTFEVEHCLVQEGNPRFRVRLFQHVVMQELHENGRSIPVLKSITIQREKWESEFRNGELLGGCATSGSAFAITPCLQALDLAGSWHYDNFAAESGKYLVGTNELVHIGSSFERREVPKNVLSLPKGLWSEMKLLEDGHFLMRAGWLVSDDIALTSICEFWGDGKAKKTMLRFETRKS